MCERELLKFKKAQRDFMNQCNAQIIKEKQSQKLDISPKNPVQVNSDAALSLINKEVLEAEPSLSKASFII